MKKLINLLRNEAGQLTALLLCLTILFWIYGCPSKAISLQGTGTLVPRAVLQMELDAFMALAEIRFAELNRQDAFRKALFNVAVLTAESGSINPYGVMATLLGVLGVGSAVDNVKMRIKIKKLNNK